MTDEPRLVAAEPGSQTHENIGSVYDGVNCLRAFFDYPTWMSGVLMAIADSKALNTDAEFEAFVKRVETMLWANRREQQRARGDVGKPS